MISLVWYGLACSWVVVGHHVQVQVVTEKLQASGRAALELSGMEELVHEHCCYPLAGLVCRQPLGFSCIHAKSCSNSFWDHFPHSGHSNMFLLPESCHLNFFHNGILSANCSLPCLFQRRHVLWGNNTLNVWLEPTHECGNQPFCWHASVVCTIKVPSKKLWHRFGRPWTEIVEGQSFITTVESW